MVDVFTTAIVDATKIEVLPPPRRHRRHGWCESVEILAAFTLAWCFEGVLRITQGWVTDRYFTAIAQ